MFSKLLILLFLPLVSCLGLLSVGKKANAWAGWVASFVSLLGLGISLYLFQSWVHAPQQFAVEWFQLKEKSFTLSLQTDNLTLIMLVLVHFVALLVQLFSISYMHDDAGRWRYFAFLGVFVFSMLLIVLAGNLFLMYVGWELVGLSSYLLIGFWYEKPRAVWAAKKAFILNRIGDAGFLMGILLLFWYFGTSELSVLSSQLAVNSLQFIVSGNELTLIGLLLFCGAVGKSAQFPLSAWLPDAMEGPTPVSALIHAATMVAAGIFLLARIYFLLTPDALTIIALIGGITMVMGAYRAIFQTDIKKLLAYSTISQLGLMVLGMGIGAREAALFHLLTHAFFKAGLFLCAGAVIHAVHTQDMRQMGNLRPKMKITFIAYSICAAALAGLPFFSGFLSKDAILVEAFAWASQRTAIAYVLPLSALVSAGLTAFYITKQWRLVFLTRPASETVVHSPEIHEADGLMKLPMVLLAGLSVFVWFSVNPLDAAHGWFFQLFPSKFSHEWHTIIATLSIIVAALGISLGYICTFNHNIPSIVQQFGTLHDAIKKAYEQGWNSVKHQLQILREHDPETEQFLFLISPLQKIGQWLYHLDSKIVDVTVNGFAYLTVIIAHIIGRFDRMVVDGAVNGAAWLARFVGSRTRNLQNGQAQSYFVVVLVGIIAVILWVLH